VRVKKSIFFIFRHFSLLLLRWCRYLVVML